VLLAPAERAEVIVDFTSAAGKSVVLESGKRTDGVHAPGTTPFVGPLMQFRVGAVEPDSTSIPNTLRPLPAWTQGLGVGSPVDKTWKITIGGNSLRPTWLLNGRTFNPARVDHRPHLDTTEVWAVVNKTSMAHVIHMHSTDWYLLSRNGHPPPPWEDCLKESFFIKPQERIHVAAHFSDFTGKYVIHCHMLDHEDHGLMGQFEIVS
jgi:spore coat protein A